MRQLWERQHPALRAATFAVAVAGLLSGCAAGTGSGWDAGPDSSGERPLIAVDHLVGISESDLMALFGPPDFTLSEPPARLFQYRGLTCVADIFLYSDDASGDGVVHIETRPLGTHPIDGTTIAGAKAVRDADDECLKDILRSRDRPPGERPLIEVRA